MASNYSKLPAELWIMIFKAAISTSWSNDAFFPPADDLTLLDGLFDTVNEFKTLVKLACPLSIHLKHANELAMYEGSFLMIEHLLIIRPLQSANEAHLLFTQLSQCKKLCSLSLPPIGKPNWDLFVDACKTSMLKDNLRRLDICYEDSLNWGTLALDFPNLEELRLAKRDVRFAYRHVGLPDGYNADQWVNFGDRWKYLACTLAHTLQGLRKLEVLSIHICLEQHNRLLDMHMSHKLRHPLENTRYWGCGQCKDAYDASQTVLVENNSTMILARRIPSLKRVSWTDAFGGVWHDERGQRATFVERKDKLNIILRREDGADADIELLDEEGDWILHGVDGV